MRWTVLLLSAMVLTLLLAGGVAMAAPNTYVDPDSLTPPPPPEVHPVCKQTGQYVICKTYFDETVNEPEFELSCGTLYLTATVHREGLRWYSDGLLVKRFVTEDFEGVLSLSPTGAKPNVRVFDHRNWWDYYAVPGDEDSAIETVHGNVDRMLLPGYGGILHNAGIYLPDGTHHGVARDLLITDDEGKILDPGVDAALCAAVDPGS